jgi:hypothetical protein
LNTLFQAKIYIAVFLLLLPLFPAIALEPPEAGDAPPEGISPGQTTAPVTAEDHTIYIIRKIDFSRTGHTRPSALLYYGELKVGDRIRGAAGLERYIHRKTQSLMNQRALEYAVIAYALGDPEEEGGPVPVDLLVVSRDSFNLFAFPKPLVDSNSGLDVTLKARDYNFLGSLTPLNIDLGYALENEETNGTITRHWDERGFTEGTFTFLVDTDIPVRLFNLNFVINFGNEFKFTNDDEEPFYYRNVTGLSVELPVSFTTATVGFLQTTTLHENNSKVYEDTGYDPALHDEFDSVYTASELFVSWDIPMGLEVGGFGKLAYTPRLSGSIKYRPGSVDWDPGDLRRGFTAGFSHSIGFSQIDWKENFRSGLSASIGNSISYNFSRTRWSSGWSAGSTGHLPITSFMGMSGRFMFNHILYGDTNSSAGDVLRGVIDKSIEADIMASLNLDFPFRVLMFLPSEWFHSRKLRFFDFEMHLSPIIDAALRVPRGESGLTPEISGGIELIVFPFFMRRVYLRGSFAINIKDLLRDGKIGDYEYFIGLYHHF